MLTLTPDNAAIVYSPGNWSVTASRALSINAGAYLSLMFGSASCALLFNTANLGSPQSEIYYRIDGYETQAPWTRANVAATITCAMPSDTVAAPYHLLEVVIKSTSEVQNRWLTPSNTAVILTGIRLDTGAAVMAPGTAPGGAVLFYGDSITEGVRTVNQTAAGDTDRNDAMMGWAYAQRALLGVEVGIIGFGGSGLLGTGSGQVPPLGQTYNLIMQGVARTVPANLRMVVLNEGTNDGGADPAAFQPALLGALNSLLTFYPSTPIAVLRTFGGYQASATVAAIAASSHPERVTYIDTTGWLVPGYGLDTNGYHPNGPNNLGVLAPLVAAALSPLLHPQSAGRSYSFA